jgi:hypothetical protein
VNMVVNLGVPYMHAICALVRLLASDEDCFVSWYLVVVLKVVRKKICA